MGEVYIVKIKAHEVSNFSEASLGEELTRMPPILHLQGVDELGVKARRDLNTHTACKKPNVHHPEVALFVPWHLVLIDEPGDNGVGSITKILLRQVDHGDNRVR